MASTCPVYCGTVVPESFYGQVLCCKQSPKDHPWGTVCRVRRRLANHEWLSSIILVGAGIQNPLYEAFIKLFSTIIWNAKKQPAITA